jgi:hypothetical protein
MAVAAVALMGSTVEAQVGYPPSASPFRDLFYRQEATLFSGYFMAADDPVGVAPQGGPIVGARYEVRIGGPAQFTVRAARVFSERTIIDPGQPPEQRVVGTRSWPLYLFDLGISFNLTGQKSWHRLVPVATLGGGIATDMKGSPDAGGYRFGTPFAISIGGGIRWVPEGPIQLRIDLVDNLYQIRYPDTYFSAIGTTPPVRTGSQSVWTHNASMTVGASYQFFR